MARLLGHEDGLLDLYSERTRREVRVLEELLAEAGLYVIGTAGEMVGGSAGGTRGGTVLAKYARDALALCQAGLLERVKGEGGPIAFRLTAAGEKKVAERRVDQVGTREAMIRQLMDELRSLHAEQAREHEVLEGRCSMQTSLVVEQREKIDALQDALDVAHGRILELERPGWRKMTAAIGVTLRRCGRCH